MADEASPSVDVGSSALLKPFSHLLDSSQPSPASPTPLTELPSRDGSFEIVKGVFKEELDDDDDVDERAVVRPGAYSAAGGSSVDGFDGFVSRRASLTSSAMFGRQTPIEFTPEEEEHLDQEWGISRIGSTEYVVATGGGGSAGDMTGVGLRQFPRSESGMVADLAREHEDQPERERTDSTRGGAPTSTDETDQEVLETKSMPDLNPPRRQSFAASILDELDGRLQGKGPTLSPEEELEARERAQIAMVKANSDGPRIKVIERRKRSRSLSTNFALDSPQLPDVATPSSTLEELVQTSAVTGKARSDSLFARPGSALAFTSTTRTRDFSSASQTSDTQPLSSSSNGTPLLPFSTASPAFISSRFRSTTHDTDLTAGSGSLEGSSGPTRPASALSFTPSAFTSRFDPNIIRQEREAQLAERPNFSNRDAGRPPHVILMPAPLAGQRLAPPMKPRKEGPSGESSGEEDEEEEEEEEEKPQRPPGALYGRSLMDIMEERKALLKAQQRAYIPGSDGRRGMMDWKDSPAAQESLAARGALAKLERRAAAEDSEDAEEEVPLALLPAGGAVRRKREGEPAAAKPPRAGMSIFGPDVLYQRELAAARKLEEEERLEREEAERRAQEVEEKRRLKEDRRKLKKKMGSKALEYRDLVDQQLVEGEFKTPGDLLRESQRVAQPTSLDTQHLEEPLRTVPSHGIAPSISMPRGISHSASDWFPPPPDDKLVENEDEDDDEDVSHRPRKPSGGLLRQHGQSGFFGSDSGEEDDQVLAQPSSRKFQSEAGGPKSAASSPAVKRLALPGEPSSQGHEQPGEDEDEDEDEDEVPLGRRYSRQSLMLSPSSRSGLPALDLNLPATNQPLAEFPNQGAEQEEEDEDDEPLRKRYSTIRAIDPDEDDIPLAIRRLSLAPSAMMTSPYSNRFQRRATITALDDDGDGQVEILEQTSKSDGGDSDDLPLGLKQTRQNPSTMQYPGPLPHPFQPPASFYGFPTNSQYFAPAPLNPHDSSMQLALAQMQMQAAMMSGGPGGGPGGPGEGIENWRRGVQ
ncbi:hypothetical protein JCM11491_005140 [Sporobolomyces phaffii]